MKIRPLPSPAWVKSTGEDSPVTKGANEIETGVAQEGSSVAQLEPSPPKRNPLASHSAWSTLSLQTPRASSQQAPVPGTTQGGLMLAHVESSPPYRSPPASQTA